MTIWSVLKLPKIAWPSPFKIIKLTWPILKSFIHFAFLFLSVKKIQGGTVVPDKAWWDLRESLEHLDKLVQKVRGKLKITNISSRIGKYGVLASRWPAVNWIWAICPTINHSDYQLCLCFGKIVISGPVSMLPKILSSINGGRVRWFRQRMYKEHRQW